MINPRDETRDQLPHSAIPTFREPPAKTERRQEARASELPDRDRIRKMAELHHKQLVHAKRGAGSDYEMLRVQTEALRNFMLTLPAAQADVFMNMYTEESSAIEREWLSRRSGQHSKEPLSPMVVTMLFFLVTVGGLGLAIYYVVARHGNHWIIDSMY